MLLGFWWWDWDRKWF